jgi:hypothetical protein
MDAASEVAEVLARIQASKRGVPMGPRLEPPPA